MYRLLVTDVDGTLLDNNSRLPKKNREAVLRCLENGIEVVLATGKSIHGISGLIEDFGLELPQITIHGAVAYDSSHNLVEASKIRPSLYKKVVNCIKSMGYPAVTAAPDGSLYSDKPDERLKIIEDIGEKVTIVENIEEDRFANDSVCMSVPISHEDPLERLLRDRFSDDLQLVRSGKFFFDILNKESTKGNALVKIADNLSIKKEDIIAIGDSYNDLSLFEKAGFSIAVSNAFDLVLKKADVIVPSNDECGFAVAIEKYVIK